MHLHRVYLKSLTQMDPELGLMDLPDEMIQTVCERMSIPDLKRFIRVNHRASWLCHSILVRKRRQAALDVLSAYRVDVSTPEKQVDALFRAAVNDRKDVIRALLELGVSPNLRRDTGDIALHAAAMFNRVATMKILLRAGANPDATYAQGVTPLHEATKNGALGAVRILLEAHANPNMTDSHGFTPLRIAVAHKDKSMVRMLLDAGANPNVRDIFGHTPMWVAAHMGGKAIMNMLVRAGGKYTAR